MFFGCNPEQDPGHPLFSYSNNGCPGLRSLSWGGVVMHIYAISGIYDWISPGAMIVLFWRAGTMARCRGNWDKQLPCPNFVSPLPHLGESHVCVNVFEPGFVALFHLRQFEKCPLLFWITGDLRQLGIHLHGFELLADGKRNPINRL